jgi:hypothetical protein
MIKRGEKRGSIIKVGEKEINLWWCHQSTNPRAKLPPLSNGNF